MTALCFLDTETTGLDPRIHQPYEVAWMLEDDEKVSSMNLPHDLTHADPVALKIGHYFERRMHEKFAPIDAAKWLAHKLRGVTLVGSNPGFDAAMLTRVIGHAPWHYRLINVAEGGMWTFGWDRPKALADVAAECRIHGHDIPEPDHTAEGDVRTTRAVYYALRAIGAVA